MQKIYVFFILFTVSACGGRIPQPNCSRARNFAMTIKHEKGRIQFSEEYNEFHLFFNPEGGLDLIYEAKICNIPYGFSAEVNVYFDADIFETDEKELWMAQIRKMEYR